MNVINHHVFLYNLISYIIIFQNNIFKSLFYTLILHITDYMHT